MSFLWLSRSFGAAFGFVFGSVLVCTTALAEDFWFDPPARSSDPVAWYEQEVDARCLPEWRESWRVTQVVWTDLNRDGLPDMIYHAGVGCPARGELSGTVELSCSSSGCDKFVWIANADGDWRLALDTQTRIVLPGDSAWTSNAALEWIIARYADGERLPWFDKRAATLNPDHAGAVLQLQSLHHNPCAPRHMRDLIIPCFWTLAWSGCSFEIIETNVPAWGELETPSICEGE